MFSFLTGKTGRERSDVAEAERRATPPAIRQRDRSAADRGWDAGDDRRSTPPEAWNTGRAHGAAPGRRRARRRRSARSIRRRPPSSSRRSSTSSRRSSTRRFRSTSTSSASSTTSSSTPNARVLVKMTLTSPACPSAQQIPQRSALQGQGDSRRHRRLGRDRLGAAVGQGADVGSGEAHARVLLDLIVMIECLISPTSTRKSSSTTIAGRELRRAAGRDAQRARATIRSAAIG